MKIIECWAISVWDGTDRLNEKYIVSTEAEAHKWVAKYKADSMAKKSIVVFDTLEEIADYEAGEARHRALAKLTPEERFLLGLDKAI